MLQTCILKVTFYFFVLVILSSSESISVKPIFESEKNLVPESELSRTPLPSKSSFLVPLNIEESLAETSPIVLIPAMSRRNSHIDTNSNVDDDILSPEPEPTCDELRVMWRKMRRIARQMELTNKVPKVRDPFVGGAYDFRPSKYPSPYPYSKAPKSSRISNVFQINGLQSKNNSPNILELMLNPKPNSKHFGAIIRDQNEHQIYKNQIPPLYVPKNSIVEKPIRKGSQPAPGFNEIESNDRSLITNSNLAPGRFVNYPLPEEALGVYGTEVNSPEERARYRESLYYHVRRPPGTNMRTRMMQLGGGDTGTSRGRIPFQASQPHPEYHYGSLVTNFPADRSRGLGRNVGTIGGSSLYHPMGGYAEFPTEINQRSSNAPARVERIDKIAASKLRNSCIRLQDKACKTNVDCYCVGNPKLFCGGKKCRPRNKILEHERSPHLRTHSYYVQNPYEMDLVRYDLDNDPIWPTPF